MAAKTLPRAHPALRWFSAVTALAAAGGISYRACRQGLLHAEDKSLDAWGAFETHAHAGADRLVAAAVLAASAHNSQPWRFTVGPGEILVHADFDRGLGAMDPYEREMFIGIGCALENMAIAAPGAGLATEIALRPTSSRELAARVRLTPAPEAATHRLEAAITRRRTDRGPYALAREIDDETLDALQAEVAGSGDHELVFLPCKSEEARRFGALTLEATQDIIADVPMSLDSAHRDRLDQTLIDERRDGPTMEAQGLAPWLANLARPGPQTPEQAAHSVWLKNTRQVQLATAAHFGLFVVPAHRLLDDVASLEVGRAWQRLHLAATLRGLACQPMNQIPERICRERQLGHGPKMQSAVEQQLFLNGGLPTFCFRIGLPTREAPHGPRRPVEQVRRVGEAVPARSEE
jgi:nitroreductase